MAVMKSEGNRVVIYVRVSKARGDQTSLSSQEKQCKLYAAERGWEIVATFIEDGKSAYRKNAKRPRFDEAMSMIERKVANVFLVWKLDRFYRSGTEFQKAWNRIDDAGAHFASVMEKNLDTSTATGRQYLSNLAFAAEIESENRSQRTTAWHIERNSDMEAGGAVGGGHRPFGYDRISQGHLTINEKEAELIRQAADRFEHGESLRGIHRSMRIPSVQGAGVMSDRGLRNVLTNPSTYGLKRLANGSIIRGSWVPILDPSRFGVIVSRFDDPIRRTNNGSNSLTHLLGGLIGCARCLESGTTADRKGKLRSRSNRNRYKCQCGNGVAEDTTDAYVTARLFEVVTPEVWQGWRIKGHGFDLTVRNEIEARIELLDMRLIEGKITNDRFDRMNDELQRQLALAMSDSPLDIPAVDNLETEWESLSVADKRRVIVQAFESITVHNANGSYNPSARININVR